jgi:hypothetical protein
MVVACVNSSGPNLVKRFSDKDEKKKMGIMGKN